MARICQICGKGGVVIQKRKKLRKGKYNPTSKKRQFPNLQWARFSNGKRVFACTKCIKTQNKKS